MNQEPITIETINPLISTGPVGGTDTLLRMVSLLHLIQDTDLEDNPMAAVRYQTWGT